MDRPELREKIAKLISEFKDWDGARQHIKDGWLYKADQILALIPDIEETGRQGYDKGFDDGCVFNVYEAKREERERIGKQLCRELDLAPRGMRVAVIEQCIEDLVKGEALKGNDGR